MKNRETFSIRGAGELGIVLSPEQVDRLLLYLSELIRWNRSVNLSGLRSDREIIIKHFLDSLTPLTLMEPVKGERAGSMSGPVPVSPVLS
ncbi:MAG: class I SAM-dependent methyltransferase [Candidatus Manganitrophus sp.]|nr:class I SAM-dependent methyltransferase [Candidatus Manganitrophus sp.]